MSAHKKPAVKIHIVKRRGHKEKYDHRKVYAAVYAACLAAHIPDKKAETIASKVCNNVDRWIKSKKTVTAHQIYFQTIIHLKKLDKNAAFMYETHMDVS